MPARGNNSSSGISESVANVELRVGRSRTIVGVVGVDCECSGFRVAFTTDRFEPEDVAGGGELKRGVRGAEDAPVPVTNLLALCRRGRSALPSCWEVGARLGIVPADRAL